MAIDEPVGKSKENDISIPKRHDTTPTIGEKIIIFFMSYENWYTEEVGFIIRANTNSPPTSFNENATVRLVKIRIR